MIDIPITNFPADQTNCVIRRKAVLGSTLGNLYCGTLVAILNDHRHLFCDGRGLENSRYAESRVSGTATCQW